MKKLFFLLSLMLIASVGNLVIAQTQWAEYELPAPTTSVTVTEAAVHVFTSDRWFQAQFPLPASGQPINWAENIIPGTGNVKASAITREGIVFILRDNGDLWRFSGGQWEIVLTDIQNLSAVTGDRFFAWSDSQIYEHNCGFTQIGFIGAKAIAFNDDLVFVFTEDFQTFAGPNYWELSPAGGIEDLHPAEATMCGEDSYVLTGEVVGGLAAWYQSPANACFKYQHVLTEGRVNSVACSKDTVWAVGWIGNKGCLFNTNDLASIKFVSETVWQVRSHEIGVVAAVSNHRLYVRGEAAMVGLKSPSPFQSDLQIIPNPIKEGNLRIISPSNREARIFDLSGQQIATLILNQGENQVNMAFLPSGIYLLEGEKFIIP